MPLMLMICFRCMKSVGRIIPNLSFRLFKKLLIIIAIVFHLVIASLSMPLYSISSWLHHHCHCTPSCHCRQDKPLPFHDTVSLIDTNFSQSNGRTDRQTPDLVSRKIHSGNVTLVKNTGLF